MNGIIEDIGLIAVFLLILLSVFLLTGLGRNKYSNIYFALFLIVTSFDISALFLQNFFKEYAQLNHLRTASALLQMPLFYFYVRATCYYNFKFSSKQVLHSIPFFGFLALFSITGLSNQNSFWFGVFAQIQYYVYIFAVFYTLNKYKKLHLENYSFQNKMFRWLMTTSILFLIGNTFVLFRGVFGNFFSHQGYSYLNLGVSLFALAVICWFVIKTMRNPDLFTGIDRNIKPVHGHTEEKKEEYREEVQRLQEYMNTYKPYLEDTLTLQNLAQKTGIQEKTLSFLINKVIGTHFFDFVNSYRIEEAKTLLQNSDLNIQQIMYEVGFNSKSSFNTAFKKFTATTPSKYRLSAD